MERPPGGVRSTAGLGLTLASAAFLGFTLFGVLISFLDVVGIGLPVDSATGRASMRVKILVYVPNAVVGVLGLMIGLVWTRRARRSQPASPSATPSGRRRLVVSTLIAYVVLNLLVLLWNLTVGPIGAS